MPSSACLRNFPALPGRPLFGVVAMIMGQSRFSIVSLIIFFVVGIFMLSKVNVEKGIRAAEAEEAEMIQA